MSTIIIKQEHIHKTLPFIVKNIKNRGLNIFTKQSPKFNVSLERIYNDNISIFILIDRLGTYTQLEINVTEGSVEYEIVSQCVMEAYL